MSAKAASRENAAGILGVVLLVEDDPLIRFDIAEQLRQLGFRVVEARNADEAIDMLMSTARLDLVVTDVRMPGERDGLDVARATRDNRPGLKTVVMSGHLVLTDEHKGLIDAFIPKPAMTHHLIDAILKLMDVKEPRRGP